MLAFLCNCSFCLCVCGGVFCCCFVCFFNEFLLVLDKGSFLPYVMDQKFVVLMFSLAYVLERGD